MQTLIPLKLVSRLLLLVLLTISIHCVHGTSHAMQYEPTVAGVQADDASATHQCPCAPEQHEDHDDCDSCCNCVCHSSLAIRPFQLSYKPFILNLSSHDPFKHIPDVYLSKFVPPQIQA